MAGRRIALDIFVAILHWLFLATDWGGLWFLYSTTHDINGKSVFGWHYVYLTIWGLTLQSIYFTFAFLIDMVHIFRDIEVMFQHRSPEDLHNELYASRAESLALINDTPTHMTRTRLEEHKDRLFSLAFPVGCLIGLAFWGGVWPFPEARSSLITAAGGFLLTFQQHGTTWIFIVVELFLVQHTYRRKRHEIPILLSFAAVYLAWNIISYFVNLPTFGPVDSWPYTLLQAGLAEHLYVGIPIYAGLFLVAFGLYMVGRLVSYYFWRCRWRYRGDGYDLPSVT